MAARVSSWHQHKQEADLGKEQHLLQIKGVEVFLLQEKEWIYSPVHQSR
jgi:hypothetical protein